ncbi:MAG: cytochrome c oxidase subunit 3 family protein [Gammaproteobacteria bacterium]|nr:cytochrome c oxidase subunit 3 family protein [Gammaproteobacteria bacterium]
MQPDKAITTHASRQLPGDLAMWLFIGAELTAFALLFMVYASSRALHPEVFAQGQSQLNSQIGLLNTMALLSSSYFVVNAVASVKAARRHWAIGHLLVAIGFGLAYVVLKSIEYYQSFSAGYGLTTNVFYQYYFLLTGFHYLHVILGLILLTWVTPKVAANDYTVGNTSGLESVASYWHMVDVLWLVLFPLVYLLH